MFVSDLHLRSEKCHGISLFCDILKRYTFKLSADLHANKYNNIWLPIELGFMLILLLKNVLSSTERWVNLYVHVRCLKERMQNVTTEATGKYLVESYPLGFRILFAGSSHHTA